MARIHLIETDFHKKNLLKIGLRKNLYVVGAPALENINYKLKDIRLSLNERNFFKEKKEKKIIACFHPETTKTLKENLLLRDQDIKNEISHRAIALKKFEIFIKTHVKSA